MLAALVVVSVVLGACVAGGDDMAGDAGNGVETSDGDTPDCFVGSYDPDWLLSDQDQDLRMLTGIEATPGGVTLSERSTVGNRAATRAALQSRFSQLGYSPLLDDYGTGINVFAELEATVATDDTLVIGAHFDSVPGSPGANDNATGVAMVLAAARYARELPCRSQNMIFVLFDEEEIGLIGSDNFAQLLKRPDFGATITAVHTIDQNGWDGDGDRAFELEQPDTGLTNLYLQARQRAGASMPIHETATGSTDHVSFRIQGFDAVGITEEYVNGDTTPHYHLSSDTYATVDREYLASTTRILLTMLATTLAESSSAATPSVGRRPALSERYQQATRQPRISPPARPHGCRSAVLLPPLGIVL